MARFDVICYFLKGKIVGMAYPYFDETASLFHSAFFVRVISNAKQLQRVADTFDGYR